MKSIRAFDTIDELREFFTKQPFISLVEYMVLECLDKKWSCWLQVEQGLSLLEAECLWRAQYYRKFRSFWLPRINHDSVLFRAKMCS
ncbi:MAG: hypothetical protein ABIG60_03635 [Patescibacteria group bacterium]